MVALEDAISTTRERSQLKLSRFLHVDAWIVKLRFKYTISDNAESKGNFDNKLFAQVEGHQGLFRFQPTKQAEFGSSFFTSLQDRTWDGMILGFLDQPGAETWRKILVLERIGDYYERVGIVFDVDCKGFFWIDMGRYRPYPIKRCKIRLG